MNDKRTPDEAIANWARIKTQSAPPRPGPQAGGIADRAIKLRQTRPEEPGATTRSRTYWTAYRAGQAAKREAGMEYQEPAWMGARKVKKPKRQWLPGEHQKPKKTKPQGDLF
jgi:hypothetical protein